MKLRWEQTGLPRVVWRVAENCQRVIPIISEARRFRRRPSRVLTVMAPQYGARSEDEKPLLVLA